MKKIIGIAMLFILLLTTACSPHNPMSSDTPLQPSQEDSTTFFEEEVVPTTTFSAKIGEVNGVVYHVPLIPANGEGQSTEITGCKPFPISPHTGKIIPSFCYYDGYVYFIESEDKARDFDVSLYRCKPDWTEVELIDEIPYLPDQKSIPSYASHYFVIHNGILFYESSLIDVGKIDAIDLSTLEKISTDPVGFYAEAKKDTPNPYEFGVNIYNDILFYNDYDDGSVYYKLVYREVDGPDIFLAHNAAIIGCANEYVYFESYPTESDSTVSIFRVPVDGGAKEILATRKATENGETFFYCP